MERELHIKMSLDNADPEKKLDDFGRSAVRATDKAADGTKKVGRASMEAAGGVDAMGRSFGGANREIADLIKAQVGLNAIRNLAANIGNEWRKVADDIGKASREWQRFRQSLQGVASLTNNRNTNAFASSEVDRAERARVTPVEAQQFREAFLAKASLYVGEGPSAKMSTEDADEFQSTLMEYAKDKGVSQADMAGFAGGLLAQQKGPISAKDMMTRVGRTFGTLEASSAPVAHLLPAMTRVMAQGYSAEEASRTLSAMPEVAPEEEGTHLLRVAAEIRRANVEGRGGDYGIRDGMTPQQQLEAVVGDLRRRSHGDPRELDRLLREFTHEEVAANTLRGMVNQVDFDQWRKVQASIPDDQLRRTIESERGTETGLQRAVDSRNAVEDARMGLRNDTVERRRQIADAELKASGAYEHLQWGQMPASALPWADDLRTRQVNLQAIRRARAELGESSGLGDAAASTNRGSTDELLRELIKRIEAQHRTQQETAEILRARNGGRAPTPMPGRPAPTPTRP